MPAATFNEDLLNRYPQPLAGAYARFIDERDAAAQHSLLLALFEALLKYLAVPALGQYRQVGGSDPAVEGSLPALRRPSLGHWAGLLRALLAWHRHSGHADAAFVFPELPALYNRPAPLEAGAAWLREAQGASATKASLRQLFDSLVEYRNAQAHGAGQSTAYFTGRVPLLQAALEEALGALPSLAAHPLAYLEGISVGRGGAQTLTLLSLMSDRPRLRPQQVPFAPAAAHPEPQQLHLLPADGLGGAVPLHPLLVFIPACAVCQEAQVGVLNGVSTAVAEYLCYGCGHTNTLPGLLADVAGFLPNATPLAPAPSPFPAEQSQAEEFTPQASPNNLPASLSSFVGRQHELAEVKGLLAIDRLVTLTGAGGSGKTRLALRVAAEVLERYPDGVWWVDLAPLLDPALVPQQVAVAVGLLAPPGRSFADILIDFFRQRLALLVFDNCEHLIAACAQLSERLLQSCAHLSILSTSREILAVPGERAFPVPTLSLPDPSNRLSVQTVIQSEAVQLFVERAVAAHPNFTLSEQNVQLVAQICRRLDGIPLAIELAAARLRSMSIAQVAARLDERFALLTTGGRTALPRHQTLRAAIDWSYDLLGAEEKGLLRRLAVFAGGLTLEAAEAVCAGAGLPAEQVLDLLAHLVEKSLVETEDHDETIRYRLLETVRQYAAEKLSESGERTAVADRHLGYFLRFVQEAEPRLFGPQEVVWINWLELENDNLRIALSRALEGDEANATAGLQLAGSLYWFWQQQGYLSEGVAWYDRLLLQSGKVGGDMRASRAKALRGIGWLAANQGDRERAVTDTEKGLALAQEVGDAQGVGQALQVLAFMAFLHGKLRRAAMLGEESAALLRKASDKVSLSHALLYLGYGATQERDFDRADAFATENLRLAREIGSATLGGWATQSLAYLALTKGEYDQASGLLQESLQLFRARSAPLGIGSSLNFLAAVRLLQGQHARAAELLTEARSLIQEKGITALAPWTLDLTGVAACSQGDYERAAECFKQAILLDKRRDYKIGIAENLVGLATVAAARSQFERGVELLSAAEAILESAVQTQDVAMADLGPVERAEYERTLALTRREIDGASFDRLWAEGHAMNLEQAIAYALEEIS